LANSQPSNERRIGDLPNDAQWMIRLNRFSRSMQLNRLPQIPSSSRIATRISTLRDYTA